MITLLCAAAHLLTGAKARGIAVKIAKLPLTEAIPTRFGGVSFSGAPSCPSTAPSRWR
jgi:hypothetical protein